VPARSPHQDLPVDVFQVNVADALAVPPEGRDGIAAADRVVPDVEAERGGRQTRSIRRAVDLLGRLDVRAGVGMERDPAPAARVSSEIAASSSTVRPSRRR
jgi:hypothetical protein